MDPTYSCLCLGKQEKPCFLWGGGVVLFMLLVTVIGATDHWYSFSWSTFLFRCCALSKQFLPPVLILRYKLFRRFPWSQRVPVLFILSVQRTVTTDVLWWCCALDFALVSYYLSSCKTSCAIAETWAYTYTSDKVGAHNNTAACSARSTITGQNQSYNTQCVTERWLFSLKITKCHFWYAAVMHLSPVLTSCAEQQAPFCRAFFFFRRVFSFKVCSFLWSCCLCFFLT